jgi:hypothetical protein
LQFTNSEPQHNRYQNFHTYLLSKLIHQHHGLSTWPVLITRIKTVASLFIHHVPTSSTFRFARIFTEQFRDSVFSYYFQMIYPFLLIIFYYRINIRYSQFLFTTFITKIAETLVNFYQTTRCYNPEDSNLHTHRRENLKSYSPSLRL